jgi:hypothetical protein
MQRWGLYATLILMLHFTIKMRSAGGATGPHERKFSRQGSQQGDKDALVSLTLDDLNGLLVPIGIVAKCGCIIVGGDRSGNQTDFAGPWRRLPTDHPLDDPAIIAVGGP